MHFNLSIYIDNEHYYVFILIILCFIVFILFYLIFQVLFNKSKKDKWWGYILQISGNLRYLKIFINRISEILTNQRLSTVSIIHKVAYSSSSQKN